MRRIAGLLLLGAMCAGGAPTHSPLSAAPAQAPEPAPRLVLARYFYRYQADRRKPLPFLGIANSDGSSALATHPWEGAGPWLSYDRVQWHRDQIQGLRAAGVDVILPVYAGSTAERSAYAVKGLDCLVQALKEMSAERIGGKDPSLPSIGLYLDTAAITRQYGGPPDLKLEEVQRTLFGMIREYYLHVPPEFRAEFQRPDANRGDAVARGAQGVLVVLGSAGAFKDLDGRFADYCARRFQQEFHTGIVWLAAADYQSRAPGLDGYLPAGPGEKAPADSRAWLQVARVRPGYDNTALSGAMATIQSRMNGRTYIQGWLDALRSEPNWVMVDGWNSDGDGTGIAPSLEYGLQFVDLTRAGSEQMRARSDYRAGFRRASLPRVVAPRALYQVEVVVQNVGRAGWGSENGVGLSYRWFQGGSPMGDAGPLVASGTVPAGETKRLTMGVTSPMSGGKPLPEGDYELRLDMARPSTTPGEGGRAAAALQWFVDSGGRPYAVPIRVGAPAALQPAWIGTTMPTLVKSGENYAVTVRLRNDGSATWRREDGAAIGYRWRRVGVYLHDGPADQDETLAEGVRTPLPADVPPGAAILVPVTVRVLGAGDRPLPVWDPKQTWVYQVEWDLYSGKEWAASASAPTSSGGQGGRAGSLPLPPYPPSSRRECVEVLATDLGPRFLGAGLATELTAGRAVTTKVGIRNTGPETWSPLRDRIVAHWYYFDGTEAAWSAEAGSLPAEVRPGDTVIPEVTVRVPDFSGPMYLVLDLKHGDSHASATLNTRSGDILVYPVNVVGGRTLAVDLSTHLDVDGISLDINRADGDLDGESRTFPGELLPPYVWRPSSGAASITQAVYPSGLWVRPLAGQKPEERICFRFPARREGASNAVRCAGQRIELPAGRRRAVHWLATATAPTEPVQVTFVSQDGSTGTQPVAVSGWTEGPRHGEAVAFTCRHRHHRDRDEANAAVHLYHYTLQPDAARSLTALILPQSPAVKLFAITLDGAGTAAP